MYKNQLAFLEYCISNFAVHRRDRRPRLSSCHSVSYLSDREIHRLTVNVCCDAMLDVHKVHRRRVDSSCDEISQNTWEYGYTNCALNPSISPLCRE